MTHSEGGWPKDVDYTEQNDTTRYRRKTEKDEDYKATVKMLGPVVDRCVRQNNTIDIYEEYLRAQSSTIVVNRQVRRVWLYSAIQTT